jgi:DNA replication protein DnaC
MESIKAQPTPDVVAMTEREVCEWLTAQGLLKPCPFDKRLEGAVRSKQLQRIVERLGVRYSMATLDNFVIYDDRQSAVIERIRKFAAGMPGFLKGGGGLLLFGDPGTGKDHIIAALLKIAVAMHGLTVEWFDGGMLFDAFADASCSEESGALRSLQSRLIEPHVLAISDPQPPKGEMSGAQVRRVRDVIDRRYRDGKSTWLSTNIDRSDDAVALLTEPVMQRLKEGSGQVLCSWPSYRETRKAAW